MGGWVDEDLGVIGLREGGGEYVIGVPDQAKEGVKAAGGGPHGTLGVAQVPLADQVGFVPVRNRGWVLGL